MRLRPLPPSVIPSNPPEKIKNRWYYPFTRIASSSVSAEEAASGSYAGYVGSVASAMDRHVLEIGSLHPVVRPDAAGTPIAYGRWLIAGMATQDGNGSFSAAVANAQVSAKKNQLATEARGLAPTASKGFRDLTGTQLDASSVRSFGEAIGSAVKWCVDNATTVDGTANPGGTHSLHAKEPRPLLSTCWALNSVATGWSVEQAMAVAGTEWSKARRPPSAVDGVTVAAIYHRLGVAPANKPTATQRELARKILRGAATMPAANEQVAGWSLDVSPFVRADMGVCDLERFSTSVARIKVGSWPASGLSAPRDVTFNTEVTANAAIAAGVAGLVEGSTQTDVRFWRWGYLTEASRDGVEGTMILTERYAAGFQAFIRFVSTDNSVNAQVIAAKATLKAMSTSMEVHIMGVDFGELDSASAFCSAAINGFDVSTVQALGAFSADVGASLVSGEGYTPCLTGVTLNLAAPEIQLLAAPAAEYCAGLLAVAGRQLRSVATVNEDGSPRPDVAFVYDRLGVTEKPTEKQHNAARELLGTGA